jgi:hypothetical protein
LLERPANHVFITLDDRPHGSFDIKVSTFKQVPKKEQPAAFSEIASDSTNTIAQSQAPSPREVSVKAWLGDSQDPSGRPDIDVFSFFGTAGDSITMRLDPDTKSGNNGGHAILRFVGPPARQVTGELPKTIRVELDSTRRYDTAVEQAEGQGEERYRGGYILTIESEQGNIRGPVPGDSVEK